MKIFVFGSNLAGVHGAGAARYALKNHGAVMGIGVGQSGQSYAIPTKDKNIETLPLEEVKKYVNEFVEFANANNNVEYIVTQIGCGLAGFTKEQIAPLFKDAPECCSFDDEWKDILGEDKSYWGTY